MNGWLTQKGYPVVNVTRYILNKTIYFRIEQAYFLLFQSTDQKPK